MVQNDSLQVYQEALREFREKSDSTGAADAQLDKHLEDSLYGYLAYVAQSGKPAFDWSFVQPFIMAQVDKVIEAMCNGVSPSGTGLSDVAHMKYRIMKRLSDFEAAPFTIQRLCELLLKPNEHYKQVDKFMRALEKTVHVVSTVDVDGRRETERDYVELNGSLEWLTDLSQEDEEANENDTDDSPTSDIHGMFSERKNSITLTISPTTPTSATSPMPSIEALWQSTLTSAEVSATSNFQKISEAETEVLTENFASSSSMADSKDDVDSNLPFAAQPGKNECKGNFKSKVSVEKLDGQNESTVLGSDEQVPSSSHVNPASDNIVGTLQNSDGISEGEAENSHTLISTASCAHEEPLTR
ncbi:PPP4R2 domain containing protein [Trichuris trichiura]|uniref:PPP4R2 domain containing protein n=1 Tax=Trichuris trichiura TaxID=36087 RepID=A0A077YVW9_TRITR|nr:PPP4R2 domain containing protein [Trichuris trichiura]